MLDPDIRNSLRARFERFAEIECQGSSPLYFDLAIGVADDDLMLELVNHALPGQPKPNLLFAAVHYLLLKEPDSAPDLARYYGSIMSSPLQDRLSYPRFRKYVMEHKDEVRQIIQSRMVQTNEVRRAAYLYLAHLEVSHRLESAPLAVCEIGTSAGLLLLFDRYNYDFGNGVSVSKGASLTIASELRGERRPRFEQTPSPIVARIGNDLKIIDVRDASDALWLRALIWPEHSERVAMQLKAVEMAAEIAIEFKEGDGVAILEDLLADLTPGLPVMLFHCHTANQLSPEQWQNFLAKIAEESKSRTIFHVLCEFLGRSPELHLSEYRSGSVVSETHLANCDAHGKWIEWL